MGFGVRQDNMEFGKKHALQHTWRLEKEKEREKKKREKERKRERERDHLAGPLLGGPIAFPEHSPQKVRRRNPAAKATKNRAARTKKHIIKNGLPKKPALALLRAS